MNPLIAQVTEAAKTSTAEEELAAESGNVLEVILEPIVNTFTGMWEGIVNSLPNVIGGAAILIVGVFVAKFLRQLVGKTLEQLQFDSLLEKAGIAAIFGRLGLKGSPTEIIAKGIFWIVILFVVKNTADSLGVEDITALIDRIMAFLPKVMTAGIIMLVGFMVADLIQSAVRTALEAVGLEYAKTLANILFGFVFVLVLTVALSQLEIETELLNASVKIILGGVAAALAICMGLGLKRLANSIVSGVYARDLYVVGTEIEYHGENVKVAGVGPVTTKLQRLDGGFIIVPNEDLINQAIRGRSAE